MLRSQVLVPFGGRGEGGAHAWDDAFGAEGGESEEYHLLRLCALGFADVFLASLRSARTIGALRLWSVWLTTSIRLSAQSGPFWARFASLASLGPFGGRGGGGAHAWDDAFGAEGVESQEYHLLMFCAL